MRYGKKFFRKQNQGSISSAKVVAPLVKELVDPKSVVDVGCGTGGWLDVFLQIGVEDIYGIDGEWVNEDMLIIPRGKFAKYDLSKSLRLGRSFDLAISLEVGEHLNQDSAGIFVQSLANLSNVILFSAAVPGQAGVNHVNEQWPEYWADLFKQEGYSALDPIRGKIWNNSDVRWWYSQNILLYVKDLALKNYPKLEQYRHQKFSLNRIHPQYILKQNRNLYHRLKDWVYDKLS